MVNRLIKTQELYSAIIKEITKSPADWIKFLDTCSNNYRFSFTDQVLIYAQKPDATYLAEIEQWNRQLHRWIKKGTRGIALIENDGVNVRLRHVFDIADTYDKFDRKISTWQVNHRFDSEIIEDLENNYGNLEMKDNLSEAIISASYNMVEDNFQDYLIELERAKENSFLEELDGDTLSYHFRKVMSNSVAYMMMKRCGLAPEDYLTLDDFREITNFNTLETITKIGMATSDIAESGLKEIYDTNKNLSINYKNKNYTFDKQNSSNYNEEKVERSEDYGNDISSGKGFTNTRYNSGGTIAETGYRNVWQSQTEISKRPQERNLVRNDNDREIKRTSSRNKPNSQVESQTNNSRFSQTEQSGRANENDKSVALGTKHEQFQTSSRGNSVSGTNLQLNLFENNLTEEEQKTQIEVLEKTNPNIDTNIAEVEITPANFYLQKTIAENMPLILSQEQIDKILIYGGVVEHSKFRIYDHLTNPYDNENPSDFLKKEYGDGGYSSEDGWIDFSSKGIKVRKGNKETILKWKNATKRTIEIINQNRFFTDSEFKEYKEYINEQKKDFAQNYVDFCIDNNIYDWLETRDVYEYDNEEQLENKTRADRVVDVLNKLNNKDEILQEIEYLNSVRLAEEGDVALTEEIEKYIFLFNRYYSEITKENEQISINHITPDNNTSDAERAIQQAQNIIDLFNTRAENGKPFDRDKYYSSQVKTETTEEKINYHITDNDIGIGTPKERYKNNIEAIKTLKQIENENRLATKEEQEILTKYVGWGGLSDAFDENKWKNEYDELKSLLTKKEYENARSSTLTAFYTPPIVINAIYQSLQNMGFEEGNILEPSCGIGNFFGMLPQELNQSKLYGVELDDISGRIAKQLYQNASIQINGFEKINTPDSFFDVAIGNVPFGSFKVNDKRYDKNNFLIHDFFFAKTLDKLRPRRGYSIYNK